jgi:hypothetical protein
MSNIGSTVGLGKLTPMNVFRTCLFLTLAVCPACIVACSDDGGTGIELSADTATSGAGAAGNPPSAQGASANSGAPGDSTGTDPSAMNTGGTSSDGSGMGGMTPTDDAMGGMGFDGDAMGGMGSGGDAMGGMGSGGDAMGAGGDAMGGMGAGGDAMGGMGAGGDAMGGMGSGGEAAGGMGPAGGVSFAEIYPILTANCDGMMCHGTNAVNNHPQLAATDMATAEAAATMEIDEIIERINLMPSDMGFMPRMQQQQLSQEDRDAIQAFADSL